MERREFLGLLSAGMAQAAAGVPSGDVVPMDERLGDPFAGLGDQADDAARWQALRRHYTLPAEYLDLDHANTHPTARPVFDAYVRRARHLSQAPAERFNTMWSKDVGERVYDAVAAYLGTQPERIALVSSTTAALNTVLHGFPLEAGDEILVTDHEYPDMVETVRQRAARYGVVVRTVKVPAPDEDRMLLVSRVTDAIGARTKLLLVSHVSAWSGEILPVSELTAAARAKGVAVCVDAAQSLGMLDVSFDAIGCDFLAASFHKWTGAPVCSGVLVMRAEWIGKVWPLHPVSWDSSKYPMTPYEWSGTFDMAARAALADALEFQRGIGLARKLERMRFLGGHWQSRLAAIPRVRVLTPRDPARQYGVASFMVDGVPSEPLAKHLRERKRILVQDKAGGRHSPFANAIRVSPGLYHTTRELDRFVAAVEEVARRGLPAG